MQHDFIDPFTSPKTIRRDATGVSCTDANGVMDYYVTVTKWSKCSVEAFTEHYNSVISQLGSFCLPQITGTTPGFYWKSSACQSISQLKFSCTISTNWLNLWTNKKTVWLTNFTRSCIMIILFYNAKIGVVLHRFVSHKIF